jgi:hypothetical protein
MDLKKSQRINFIFIIIVLVIFTIYFRNTHTTAVTFDIGDTSITLEGPSGAPDPVTVPFSDILSISYLTEFDPGENVDGLSNSRCYFGTFQNDAYGTYTLCAYPKVKEYILMNTTDGVIVFNYDSTDSTGSFYTAFKDYLEQLGYDIREES